MTTHIKRILNMNRKWTLSLALFGALAALSTQGMAQSLFSGDIQGTVSDPTGAVVPGASVALKSIDTGATQNTTAGATGTYRFTLLKPGHYTVTASQNGFQKAQR